MSGFNVLLLLVWVIATIALPMMLRKRGLHEAQMVATGMGILGTFIGIVFGLYHFDVTNIEQAVPELLNGLRFAFYTSIIGMAWSLAMGMIPDTFGFPKPEQDTTGEPYLLGEILKEMRGLREDMAGQGTDSMVTQLQKLRSDQNDNHKEVKKIAEQAEIDRQKSVEMLNAVRSSQEKLVTTFEKFTEEMAKQNVEALIQAVQQVMDDFTRVINDQLENTFNELKEAAKELVVWQREHKEDMTVTKDALVSASTAMQTAVTTLAKIQTEALAFEKTAESLEKTMNALGSSMVGMENLAKGMEGKADIIQKQLTNAVEVAIKESGAGVLGISERLVADIKALQGIVQALRDSIGSQK